MRDEQRKIVSNALESLSTELVTKVIQEGCFITQILDEENKKYVMVDFTIPMEMDYGQFITKSQRLYETFALIPYWHKC